MLNRAGRSSGRRRRRGGRRRPPRSFRRVQSWWVDQAAVVRCWYVSGVRRPPYVIPAQLNSPSSADAAAGFGRAVCRIGRPAPALSPTHSDRSARSCRAGSAGRPRPGRRVDMGVTLYAFEVPLGTPMKKVGTSGTPMLEALLKVYTNV